MKLLVLNLAAALLVDAAPAALQERATCTTVSQRKAWHTLTRDEKSEYIDAVKCLMEKPAKLGLTGPRTRFDEFQKLHVLSTENVHFVGAFLPFHRYLMHTYEHMLKTECGYTGTQPYWDEALDAGNFTHSVVLDPETGFGGDGAGPDHCIKDGPFKDYINSIGPGQKITDHCIDRQISECASEMGAEKNVQQCMQKEDFATMWPCLEGLPHSAGHGGVGGEMTNLWSSPGDPVFYLHHTYLDKLWWQWQIKDLPVRLKDIAGTNKPMSFGSFPGFPGNGTIPGFLPNGTIPGFPSNGTFPGFPGNGTLPGFPGNGSCSPFMPPTTMPPQMGVVELQKRDGDPGNVTTLSHVLTMFGMLPNVTIGDVMDTQGGLLCYEYV